MKAVCMRAPAAAARATYAAMMRLHMKAVCMRAPVVGASPYEASSVLLRPHTQALRMRSTRTSFIEFLSLRFE
jgi:hypothetical protein